VHESSINWWGIGSAYSDAPALGWFLLTFAIFLFAVVYFVRKPLLLYLETRALDIERAIEEAKKAKAEAERRVGEYEARLRALDGEIEKLKAEFLKQGEQEKAAFERSAAQLAAQIAKEAEDNLASEVRRALFSLKSDMADAIIGLARRQLETSGDAKANEGLSKVFAQGVSDIRN
jgi:F-type H+-transporting ATPase subunit b